MSVSHATESARRARALTLVDLLRLRADDGGEARFTMLADDGSISAAVTYAELERRARAIGGYLQHLGLAGRCAVLLYPQGLEFIAAFFGCMYAGVVAVPAPLPRSKRDKARLQRILADSGAAAALTIASKALLLDAQRQTADGTPLRVVATDEVEPGLANDWRNPNVAADALAYLQYTSGSTADPKGVMVSHRNVLCNVADIDAGFRHTRDSIAVSWLPYFHDMGLVYGIVQPIAGAFSAVLMSPMAFMQRPLLWLRAIDRFDGTHSGGPNFAYDLCVRSIAPEDRETLHLANWCVAFNGAEPVRAATMARFVEAFGQCGFRTSCFCPAYGLAEATLKVSSGCVDEPPLVCGFDADALTSGRVSPAGARGARALVGCGRIARSTEIAIVDPQTSTRCAAERVGEIWIAGPSVTQGYWRRPDETARAFGARLTDSPADPFLRTGDLGFVHDDHLFIAGRLKELIVIRGHNYYPQDLEACIDGCHTALRPGAGAAFSIDVENEERLVVLLEVERACRNPDVDAIGRAIRRVIGEEHEVQVHAVVLVRAGTIPKTSSGKIQRNLCRSDYLRGALEIIGTSVLEESETRAEFALLHRELLAIVDPGRRRALLQSHMRQHLAAALGVLPDALNSSDSLVGQGLDSLAAAECTYWIERELRVALPITDLLRGWSIDETVDAVLDRIGKDVDRPTESPASADAGNDYPLWPEQERLWFLHELNRGTAVYNIPAAFRLEGPLSVGILDRSLTEVIRRHEPLRANVHASAGKPAQTISAPFKCGVPVVDLSGLAPAHGDGLAMRLAREQAQRPFDLGRDRLLRVTVLRLGATAHLLVLVAHHIVFDGESLAVLLGELSLAYQAMAAGRPSPLRPLAFHYRDAVARQRTQIGGALFETHLRYWAARLEPARRAMRVPTDRSRHGRRVGRAAQIDFELPTATLPALRAFGRREQVTPFMTLLGALMTLLAAWTQERIVTVGSPTRGRVFAQAADLIGLFAFPLPISTDVSGNPSLSEIVARVRERVIEAAAHAAVPFANIIQAANPERRGIPPFQVMFDLVRDPLSALALPGIAARRIDVGTGACEFDLWLTIVDDRRGGLSGSLVFDRDLFTHETAVWLTDVYHEILATCLDRPYTRLEQLAIRRSRAALSDVTWGDANAGTIALASSFTSDALRKPIAFWMEYWRLPLSIEFAPFAQVFQPLLDAKSVLRSNTTGVNVLALRIEDLCRADAAVPTPRDLVTAAPRLGDTMRQLIAAVRTAAVWSSVPLVVCLCPSAPVLLSDAAASAALGRAQEQLLTGLGAIEGVYLVTPRELQALYPVADYYDAYGDALTRTPFSELCFTALGTLVARKIYALRAAPCKAIVVDCDDTLWTGACGDGQGDNVTIDQPRRVLQAFLVAQRSAGTLLCLCSRNNEDDVWRVFELHSDMPLRREHLTTSRINWRPKSENVRSIGEELGLDPGAIVFIDDSPFECAEVEANCAGVVTLQLPAPDRVERFLQHLWVFDRLTTTADDAARPDRYRDSRRRAAARERATSLEEFLRSLELVVRIAPVAPGQWPRIAQLTQRTNQFNLATIRRSESELRRLCMAGPFECLAVEASDRFGDYGIVGAVLFEVTTTAVAVDTFVLSCRALGRRIEYEMLGALADVACRRGRDRIDLPLVPSPRNRPAREFVEEVGAGFERSSGDGSIFTVPLATIEASVARVRTRHSQEWSGINV